MTSSGIQNKPARPFDKEGAANFSRIAENIFAPIYPVLADQIIRDTGITAGRCVDVGAGPGHLGLALAEQNPELSVVLCDASNDMLALARANAGSCGWNERVRVEFGLAECLPFEDESVQLVVSRGSIFFWNNQAQGLDEIYRILAPGGCAWIGGGFGTAALQAQVQESMKVVAPNWEKTRQKRLEAQGQLHFEQLMKTTRVPEYEISKTEAGLWIRFRK